MPILAMLFYGVSILASLASFVCFILVLVQMFKRAGTGLGIVGIITCGLGAFIWGWIKAKEFELTKIMLGWTAAIAVSIISSVVAGGLAVASLKDSPEFQNAFKKGMEDAARKPQDQEK